MGYTLSWGARAERQAWWTLHLRGAVDAIILNARLPFVSGELEARGSFTVYDTGRARTTEVLQTLIGRQPLWSEASSLLLRLLSSQIDKQAADLSESIGKFQQHPLLRLSGLHWARSKHQASVGSEKRGVKS